MSEHEYKLYLIRMLVAVYWGWLILPFVILLGWKWPLLGDRLICPIERFGRRLARKKGLAILAISSFVLVFRLCLLPIFPIRPPGIHDEFSYLVAADTFAHGKLANPPHPMWLYFDTMHILQHPSVQSMYPPAQGAALALGQLIGHPWFGVLLSMSLMFGALLWMLQGWLPPEWALLGTLLPLLRIGTFSYWMNSYWGGAVAALGGCLLLGAFPRILRKPSIRDSVFLGLGVTLLVNSRPFEGALACAAVLIALATWIARRRRDWRVLLPRVVLPLALVLSMCAAFMLYYNWRVTGDPLLLPHALGDRLTLSYSNFVWLKPGPPLHFINHEFEVAFVNYPLSQYRHTWDDFLRITRKKASDFQGFFVGADLVVPFVALPWLFLDRRPRFALWLFIICAAGAVIVVWYTPHYTAPVFAALSLLIAQLVRHLRHWKFRGRLVGIGLTRSVFLMCLLTFCVSWAEVASNPRAGLPLGWGWFAIWDRAYDQQQLESLPGKHLVIVRYSQTHHDVGKEWVYNNADIDASKVIWAREIPGISMQPLLDYYRDRRVWLVEPDTTPRTLTPYALAPPVSSASSNSSAPRTADPAFQ